MLKRARNGVSIETPFLSYMKIGIKKPILKIGSLRELYKIIFSVFERHYSFLNNTVLQWCCITPLLFFCRTECLPFGLPTAL